MTAFTPGRGALHDTAPHPKLSGGQQQQQQRPAAAAAASISAAGMTDELSRPRPGGSPVRLSLLLREFHELEQDWGAFKDNHKMPAQASKQHVQPCSSPAGEPAACSPGMGKNASGADCAPCPGKQRSYISPHANGVERPSSGKTDTQLPRQGRTSPPPSQQQPAKRPSPADLLVHVPKCKQAISSSLKPLPAQPIPQKSTLDMAHKKAMKKKKWVPPPWNNDLTPQSNTDRLPGERDAVDSFARPSSGCSAELAAPQVSPKLQRGASLRSAASVSDVSPEVPAASPPARPQPEAFRQRRKWKSPCPTAVGSEPSQALAARAGALEDPHTRQQQLRTSRDEGSEAHICQQSHAAAAMEVAGFEAEQFALHASGRAPLATPPSPPWSDLVRQGSVTLGATEDEPVSSKASATDIPPGSEQGSAGVDTTMAHRISVVEDLPSVHWTAHACSGEPTACTGRVRVAGRGLANSGTLVSTLSLCCCHVLQAQTLGWTPSQQLQNNSSAMRSK